MMQKEYYTSVIEGNRSIVSGQRTETSTCPPENVIVGR